MVKTDYGYHVIKADKESDFDKQKSKLKAKLIEQKVQKDPKILTNAYKDLLKEYDVDYKDSDIKKAVENTILNPENLNNNSHLQIVLQLHQVYLHNFHSINIKS